MPRDAGLLPLMNSAYYVTRRDDVPRSPRDPGQVVLSASASAVSHPDAHRTRIALPSSSASGCVASRTFT